MIKACRSCGQELGALHKLSCQFARSHYDPGELAGEGVRRMSFVLIEDNPDRRGLQQYAWTDEVADQLGLDEADRISLGEGDTVFVNGVAYYVEDEGVL
jgi:hypothetical protein